MVRPKLGMAMIVASNDLYLCDLMARTSQTHHIWDFLEPIRIFGGQDRIFLIINVDGLILLGNPLTEELREVPFQDIAALLYGNGQIFGLLHDEITSISELWLFPFTMNGLAPVRQVERLPSSMFSIARQGCGDDVAQTLIPQIPWTY